MVPFKREESGFLPAVFRKMSFSGSVMSMADRSLYDCHVTHVCVLYAVLLCVVAGEQLPSFVFPMLKHGSKMVK